MTAPERIWADPAEIFDGVDIWRDKPAPRATEYVRADLHDATKAQLAKAVDALRGLDKNPKVWPDDRRIFVRAVLAEIEKGEPK